MNGRSVLIVEDDTTLRRFLVRGFEKRGWRPTGVDGAGGVDAAARGRAFGGVITDYHVGNGCEQVLAAVEAVCETVVVFTGDVRLTSEAVSGHVVLHKPSSLAAMLEAFASKPPEDPAAREAARKAAGRIVAILDGRSGDSGPGEPYGTWIEDVAARLEAGEISDLEDARAEAETVLAWRG